MAVNQESKLSQVAAILGAQWGDEGKGKIVDMLSLRYDICCRFNGGSNAGHTIVVDGVKYAFHLLPSGIVNPKALCFVGNGCVIYLRTLLKELEQLDKNGVKYADRLLISDRAHLVFDLHQFLDGARETELASTGNQLGTTRRGIGPAYCEKANRSGIRVGDLLVFSEFSKKLTTLLTTAKAKHNYQVDIAAEIKKYEEIAAKIKPFIVDGVFWVNSQIKNGKKLLLEGANAAMLDLDFGTYPYVTSSNPTIGGAITGLGIPPHHIKDVIGVMKAYTTRVGDGPFPSELSDTGEKVDVNATNVTANVGAFLRAKGREFGTTTGRPRRCGWLDLVVMKYTTMINGYTAINLTKLDILSGLKELKVAVAYKHKGKLLESIPSDLNLLSQVDVEYVTLPGWNEDISQCKKFNDLPLSCQNYVKKIEEEVKVKVVWIGTGAGRTDMIEKWD